MASDWLEILRDWQSNPVCTLCLGNGPFHRHHKKFRSHGGSDRETNLVLLCEVCHGAVHGLKVVKDGRSCKTCPRKRNFGCYFGEKLLGEEIQTDPPWPIDQFGDE